MHRVHLPAFCRLGFRIVSLLRPLASSAFAVETQSCLVSPICTHLSTTAFAERYCCNITGRKLHVSYSSTVLGVLPRSRSWCISVNVVEAQASYVNARTYTSAGIRAGKMEVIPDTDQLIEVNAGGKLRNGRLGRTHRSASKEQRGEKKSWCELASLMEGWYAKEEALKSRLNEVMKHAQELISLPFSGMTCHLEAPMCSVFLSLPTQNRRWRG